MSCGDMFIKKNTAKPRSKAEKEGNQIFNIVLRTYVAIAIIHLIEHTSPSASLLETCGLFLSSTQLPVPFNHFVPYAILFLISHFLTKGPVKDV